ncbi:MAG: ATP-NAD kinase family protein [Gammaproteobacteria bacterium]|nr:ATP-NAD kinase family protein [Gammaproteobacteria bacterium]
MRHRLGLIINPVSGMGGAVGLKGTDGDRALQAVRLGAVPGAGLRAEIALSALTEIDQCLEVLTCSGNMGAEAVSKIGLPMTIVHRPAAALTSAVDTRTACKRLLEAQVELILFAGGDGTARDVLDAVGKTVPVLGIPSGVKMHSAVFANSARGAGDVARAYLVAADRASLLQDAEVMDRDDSNPDVGSPSLYGYLRTPRLQFLVAPAKASGAGFESIDDACRRVAESVRDGMLTLIGPGTTMRCLKRQMGFEGTLLGVDAVRNGSAIGLDLNEKQILKLLQHDDARLIVSPVGGQGFLFGRGNQQLSAAVIRKVGLNRIIVVSSLEKLAGLSESRLLVDTGDEQLDAELAGYIPVIVGRRRVVQFRVCSSTPVYAGK